MKTTMSTLAGRSIAATVACIIMALCLFQTSARAQAIGTCPPSSVTVCTGVTIYNCTGSPLIVSFKLCCNGVERIESVNVPNIACPNAAGTYDFSPCTIMAVNSIISTSAIQPLYQWNVPTCSLRIYL